MNISNRFGNFILVISILIHVGVFIGGLVTNQLVCSIALLNAIFGFIILTYWTQHEMRITQHAKDVREIVFLCSEVLIFAVSIYFILSGRLYYWLTILQYVIFALHLIMLLLLFAFMLTFKMKKLF